jgi:hypothetical protein
MSTVDTKAAAPATPEATAPVIQITDLQNAVQIIDYACEQGAFKGWKVIEQVIAVREKLAAFLNAAAPAPAEEAPAPAAKPAAKKAATKKTAAKK